MFNEPVNVLLIEDNAEHTALLTQLLSGSETTHFTLQTATTLAQGLARLRDGGFGLIILDLQLPDSDGIETFIRTIEVAPEIPLVVLSGLQDVSVAIETVQLGAQDYLVKGRFDNQVLIRSLQYAIERKRVQLQLKRVNEDLENRVRDRTAALQDSNNRLRQEVAERARIEQTVLETNRRQATADRPRDPRKRAPPARAAGSRNHRKDRRCPALRLPSPHDQHGSGAQMNHPIGHAAQEHAFDRTFARTADHDHRVLE